MALYRLSAKVGRPGRGRVHFDYIVREGKYKKERAEEKIFATTKNLPLWATSARDFWKEEEKKMDGFRKIELALPRECSPKEWREMTEEFCEHTFGKKFTYTIAIHDSMGALHKTSNPHVHIMFSERERDENRPEPTREEYFKRGGKKKDGTLTGGYRKSRKISGGNRKAWLLEIRKSWEVVQNRFLGSEKVDCRSYEAQGVQKVPTKHLGPKKTRLACCERERTLNEFITLTNHQLVMNETSERENLLDIKNNHEDIKDWEEFLGNIKQGELIERERLERERIERERIEREERERIERERIEREERERLERERIEREERERIEREEQERIERERLEQERLEREERERIEREEQERIERERLEQERIEREERERIEREEQERKERENAWPPVAKRKPRGGVAVRTLGDDEYTIYSDGIIKIQGRNYELSDFPVVNSERQGLFYYDTLQLPDRRVTVSEKYVKESEKQKNRGEEKSRGFFIPLG